MLALPLGYEPEAWPVPPRLAVMFHAFHVELAPEFLSYFAHLPQDTDLFLTTDSEDKRRILADLVASWGPGSVSILVTPNRGRDIAPKLVGLGPVHGDYDLVLHLHTKHSSHESGLGGWRGYLLETLLGSPAVVRGVLEAFRQWPRLGMLAPQHIDQLRPWIRWGENYDQASDLAERMGVSLPRRAPLDFPSGSMFWARPQALAPLLTLGLQFSDFPEEDGRTDGTLAHAVERLYFFACEAAGYDWMKITRPGMLHEQFGLQEARSPAELRRALGRSILRLQNLSESRRPFTDQPVIPFFPPRPKRLPYLPWRGVTGDPAGSVTGRAKILFSQDDPVEDGCLTAAHTALRSASDTDDPSWQGACAVIPRENVGDGVARSFAAGADLVLVMSEPAVLHPGAVTALLRMAQAHGGKALLEPACVPPPSMQLADGGTFHLAHHASDTIAIPRAAYEAMGPLGSATGAEAFTRAMQERAEAADLPLLLCPDALLFPQVAPAAGDEPEREDALDILIRLEDETDLALAERSLFTILGQTVSLGLTVHFMLTRFPQSGLRALRERTERLRHLNPEARVQFHNWDEPSPFDVRAAVLNQGLSLTEGRYLMILEPTDILFPQALAQLWARVSAAEAPLALGYLQIAPVFWWGETILPRAPESQSAEIFMLDRSRLAPRDTAFRRTAENGEIAQFIADVRATHPVAPTIGDGLLGLRQRPL
ncbi:hypothetical protein Acid7E03_35090 [Acidisoma sp. 7E03]